MFKFKAKGVEIIRRWLKVLSLSLVILILAYCVIAIAFLNKAAPHTYFAGKQVAAKSHAEVEQIVSKSIDDFSKGKITFYVGDRRLEATLDDLGLSFDKQMSARSVFGSSSDGFLNSQLQMVRGLFFSKNVEPVFGVDTLNFGDFLNMSFAQIEKPAQNSTVILGKNGAQILPYQNGVIVDRARLVHDLNQRLGSLSASPIGLTYVEDLAQVDAEGASEALKVANALAGRTVTFTYKYDRWPIAGAKLFDLLKFDPESDESNLTSLDLGST